MQLATGSGDKRRTYPVYSSEEKWKAALKESFPGEEKAIDEFFQLVNQVSPGGLDLGGGKVVRTAARGRKFKGSSPVRTLA